MDNLTVISGCTMAIVSKKIETYLLHFSSLPLPKIILNYAARNSYEV